MNLVILLTILVAALATFATYYISMHLDRGPVFASALVTLTAGILFSFVSSKWAVGLGAAAASGSYAAMVSKERFPKIADMIFLGALTGIMYLLTEGVFQGVGGRLGSVAAISGFAYLGIKGLRRKVKGKIKR